MPLLVVHGEDDKVIPSSHGRALYEGSPSRRKAGFFPPNLGHDDWRSKEALCVLRRFVRVHVQDWDMQAVREEEAWWRNHAKEMAAASSRSGKAVAGDKTVA